MSDQRRLKELAGIRMHEESTQMPKSVFQIDLHTGYAESAPPADFMDAQQHGSLEDEGYKKIVGGKGGPHGGGDVVVYMGDDDAWIITY